MPFAAVVHERVVVVPPLTAKVTVAPATGWPFWSATLTSTHDVHEKKPTCPLPVRLVMVITTAGVTLLTVTGTGG